MKHTAKDWAKLVLGMLADIWWGLTMASHLHNPDEGICIGYLDNRDGRNPA